MACTESLKIQPNDNRVLGVMITQTFKHKDGDIRIENAETLEEAKAKGFQDGVFTRYFVGDKQITAYGDLIKHIIDKTCTGAMFQPPSQKELQKMQREMISSRKRELTEQLERLKKSYAGVNIPKEVLAQIDKMMEAIDLSGVRVTQ